MKSLASSVRRANGIPDAITEDDVLTDRCAICLEPLSYRSASGLCVDCLNDVVDEAASYGDYTRHEAIKSRRIADAERLRAS